MSDRSQRRPSVPPRGSGQRRRAPASRRGSTEARGSAPASFASTDDGALRAHEAADQRTHARIVANRRRRWALCLAVSAAPAIVIGVLLGVLVGPIAGAAAFVAVLVAMLVAVVRASLHIALRVIGGHRLDPNAAPALANQVEGLSATLGVTAPELWMVDDPSPNSCTLAGLGGRSVVVVTSGLLDVLGVVELEGVVAHELVHLKRHDAALSAMAVATVGLLSAVIGIDGLLHRAVGRGREYDVDRAAVLAVRYPPGLRDALASMSGNAGRQLPRRARGSFGGWRWSATRWIWIDPMMGTADPAPIGELDATVVRMEALSQW